MRNKLLWYPFSFVYDVLTYVCKSICIYKLYTWNNYTLKTVIFGHLLRTFREHNVGTCMFSLFRSISAYYFLRKMYLGCWKNMYSYCYKNRWCICISVENTTTNLYSYFPYNSTFFSFAITKHSMSMYREYFSGKQLTRYLFSSAIK